MSQSWRLLIVSLQFVAGTHQVVQKLQLTSYQMFSTVWLLELKLVAAQEPAAMAAERTAEQEIGKSPWWKGMQAGKETKTTEGILCVINEIISKQSSMRTFRRLLANGMRT